MKVFRRGYQTICVEIPVEIFQLTRIAGTAFHVVFSTVFILSESFVWFRVQGGDSMPAVLENACSLEKLQQTGVVFVEKKR